MALPATRNDIILDSDILLDSDWKVWMQYVISNLDPDIGDGKRETMGVTLTASDKWVGVVDLDLPDESGGMVGAQDVLGNP